MLRVHHFSAVYSPTIGSISNLIFQKQENCMVTCPEPLRWLGGLEFRANRYFVPRLVLVLGGVLLLIHATATQLLMDLQ